MFKINFPSLCFWAVIFLNNPSMLCFSSPLPPTTQSERSLFPDIFQQAGNNDSTAPLFPIDSSITPQPHNWYFNSSTNTFIPPFMLAGWGNNMSTDTFNINYLPLPIIHESEDFNNASANTNNRASSLIPNDSLPSNTTNTSVHTVVLRTQQVAHANRNKDHALSKKNKKEKKKKVKKKKHSTKSYGCPKCNKKLASRNALNYHIKTHDPNRARPFQCNICPKSFIKKDALKKHIERHNNEKPFKCGFCSKYFKTKHEKAMHHRTHTGEKLFKCDICQKGLSSKEALRNHLNWHRGKKPYKCTQCTKSYVTKHRLNYHLNTHNRSKYYTCKYCDAAFAYKNEYESHVRYEEKEGDEDCKCHSCKKVYTNKYCLREHNKKFHPET